MWAQVGKQMTSVCGTSTLISFCYFLSEAISIFLLIVAYILLMRGICVKNHPTRDISSNLFINKTTLSEMF